MTLLVVTGTRKRNEVIIDAKGSVLHTLTLIMRKLCAAMSLYYKIGYDS